MISQSITLYQSWQETDGMNQLGYLRTVQYIKVKDLFNQKDYCSSLWLITSKFDNFYEVKRKKKKHQEAIFELGSVWSGERAWLTSTVA